MFNFQAMDSGKLELCGGNIRYWAGGAMAWELPVSSLRIIGEVTNDHGPFLDDYFLCFAADADSWYEAPFYAEGRREFLASLAALLGHELKLNLVGSTDYDSNVLWPPHLEGKPLFSFKPVPPGTWVGWVIGPRRNTQEFSEEVLAELHGGIP